MACILRCLSLLLLLSVTLCDPLPFLLSFLPSTYRNPVQHWQQRIFLFRCIQINGAVRTSLATVNTPAAGVHPGADQDFVLLS
ncbi:hypothetical protein BKA57DRAFT_470555 [Linnemannia elongata]|nr:hypothetical protein BKA57DRAFT_470555 [Linnemannia elongata]